MLPTIYVFEQIKEIMHTHVQTPILLYGSGV